MKRHYRHKETGQKFPAVSDIVPSGYEGCPEDNMQDVRARGTYVHAASVLLDSDNLDWSTVPEEYKPFCSAWPLAVSDLKLSFIDTWTERPSVSLIMGVAGTPDRIGTVGSRITPVVIDIKTGDSTSKKLKDLWGLRLAGYELIYKEVEGYRGKMNRIVIQLHSTGKFTPYPLDDPSDHAAFRNAANFYKWKMSRGLL